MPLKIVVLVGSMTGTARMVAQEIELAFGGDDVAIRVVMMDGVDHSVFAQPAVFLICTSTYGQGDVPDNAKALYADLLGCRADLCSVRYGVFALGDRTHVGTFCFGGKRFDEALRALGARRCGPVFEHNASGGTLPEDVALEWFPEWLDIVRAETASADSSDAAYQSR